MHECSIVRTDCERWAAALWDKNTFAMKRRCLIHAKDRRLLHDVEGRSEMNDPVCLPPAGCSLWHADMSGQPKWFLTLVRKTTFTGCGSISSYSQVKTCPCELQVWNRVKSLYSHAGASASLSRATGSSQRHGETLYGRYHVDHFECTRSRRWKPSLSRCQIAQVWTGIVTRQRNSSDRHQQIY